MIETIIAGVLLWCPIANNYEAKKCNDGLMVRQRSNVIKYHINRKIKGKRFYQARIEELDDKVENLTFKRVKKAKNANIIIRYFKKQKANAVTVGKARLPIPVVNGNFAEINKCIAEVKKVTNEYSAAVALHELGHCIGMKHDENKNSFMYYNRSGTEDQITEQNILTLEKLYKGKTDE